MTIVSDCTHGTYPRSRRWEHAAAGQLQIFNLDTKARVKSHTISDPIQYWRWIDAATIALVR
jgi:hypothetical protein